MTGRADSFNPELKEILKSKSAVIVEYMFWDGEGVYFIQVNVDRKPNYQIGPFESVEDRQRAYDDLLNMMRDTGAVDLSPRPH